MKSSWRKYVQPASFGDAEFDYHGGSVQFGRRGPVIELPATDGETPAPVFHDFGDRALIIKMRCSVGEPGYMEKRRILMDALRKRGPQKLVHPTLGTYTAVCSTPAESSEDIDKEGGRAKFTLVFTVVQAGSKFPPGIVDTQGKTKINAASFIAACRLDFMERFSLSGAAGFVSNAATLAFGVLSAAVNDLAAPFSNSADTFASMRASVSSFDSAIDSLVQSPGDVFDEFGGLVSELSGLVGADSKRETVNKFRTLFNLADTLDSVDFETAQRYLEAINKDAIFQLNKRQALYNQALAMADNDYEIFDEAIADRDLLNKQIKELISHRQPTSAGGTEPIGDDVFYALQDLRKGIIDDVSSRAADLPRLVDYQPNKTMSALYMAHRIYGDATRADEIVSRNDVSHPGFLSGTASYKVLADV